MSNNYNFEEIVNHFNYEGDLIKVEPYGSGHINDTFAVTFNNYEGEAVRYILQRINTNIFKEPEKLM